MAENEYIYASSLKGYCPLGVCWQYLHDLADAIADVHAQGCCCGTICLNRVRIEGRHFIMPQGNDVGCVCSDIWSLAASAMELVLGSPILNGKGEGTMKANTPVPLLSYKGYDAMNALLQRCLAFDKEQRPTAVEVRDIAKEEIKRLSVRPREKRRLFASNAANVANEIDEKWPESMIDGMKNMMLTLLLALFTCLPIKAQAGLEVNGETETAKLLNAVLLLREAGNEQWNEAQEQFAKYVNLVTLMDELKDRENDCLLVKSSIRHFGVNRIINAVKRGRRVQNSGKELLDGADARFKYSIYEKGVKKGCTATYKMTKRNGKQVFVIVPYVATQMYDTQLYVEGGAVYEPTIRDNDGVTYYYIDTEQGPCDSDILKLKITNADNDANASFVVINHNYRNK